MSPSGVCKQPVILASRHTHGWWATQAFPTMDRCLFADHIWNTFFFFFSQSRAHELLTETGIAWDYLLPSCFEGNSIPWFDPAVPSPVLIAPNLNDILICSYCFCAALALWYLGGLEGSEGLCTHLLPSPPAYQEVWSGLTSLRDMRQPRIRSKVLFELFPHGLSCWPWHGGRHSRGTRGGGDVGGPQDGRAFGQHPRSNVSAGTVEHIGLFARWICSC